MGEVELEVVADEIDRPPRTLRDRHERDRHADRVAAAVADDLRQQEAAVAPDESAPPPAPSSAASSSASDSCGGHC
jgi:hypothetical protein